MANNFFSSPNQIIYFILTSIVKITCTRKESNSVQLTKLEAFLLFLDLPNFGECCRISYSTPYTQITHLVTGKLSHSRTVCTMTNTMYRLYKNVEKIIIVRTNKRHIFSDNLLNFFFCIIQKTLLNNHNHNHAHVKIHNGIRKSVTKNSMPYENLLHVTFHFSKILK